MNEKLCLFVWWFIQLCSEDLKHVFVVKMYSTQTISKAFWNERCMNVDTTGRKK